MIRRQIDIFPLRFPSDFLLNVKCLWRRNATQQRIKVLLFCLPIAGGLKEFCRDYQNLCENAPLNVCHVTDFPPSPTTLCDSNTGRPQGTPVTAILPYLYLGNEEGAADEALIDRLSIKYILNLTPRCPNFFSQRSDMHYKQIKINDSNQEDIEQHFDEAIQFIGESPVHVPLILAFKNRPGE